MIAEALQYAATYPVTAREFRPFIGSSVSLWSRAGRCAGAWSAHEENCKAFIDDTITGMRQRRTAVVLGSGLLRDVPIKPLSHAFDTVVLIDLVHLASVRLWLMANRLRNVRLISRDLSGFAEAAAGRAPEPLSFLRQVPYLDLVISANLLSQIGVGAERRLERETAVPAPGLVPRLIQAHLDGLAALPCSTILLSDVSFAVLGHDGETRETADLLHGVSAPQPQARWTWPVVPTGEESRQFSVVHDVAAVRALR
ncbi:hypothetical protein [Pseudorhizobium marinum]|nr:hypothetical protein [Pseudorhizobium marinum]|tara:strand:- start:9519 stop:10283 length:765 start_codon:yes stop_codon:yes gene_type:complete